MNVRPPSPGRPRPAVLCILDGWGCRAERADNAIAAAGTPHFDRMWREWPHARLKTSGRAVGLPDGQMGNSEVGHTNIGAGRLVMQDLPRIDDAVAAGTLKNLPAFQELVAAAKASAGAVHLMGLISPGGVHSHQNHIAALAKDLADAGLVVHVHAFLDGRDTPPKSALGYMETFLRAVTPPVHGGSASPELRRSGGGRGGEETHGVTAGFIRLATISGRYYAMDRDKRWERVHKAYDAIVSANALRFADAKAAIEDSYAAGITDEFVLPRVIGNYTGVVDGDVLLFGNFRPDRAREISIALLDPEFGGFERGRTARFAAAAGLTEYSDMLKRYMRALFPPQDVSETIGQVFAERGLKQLRIAETEKYAHVTFFMNGGRETVFEGEDRILVPSPRVATYDLKPEMSAPEVTEKLVEAIRSGKYDLIICNYANPDMVGHTGIMDAAIHAVRTIDDSLGKVSAAVEEAGGLLLLTADHGNIEMMKDPETGEPHTAHTLLDVPLIALGKTVLSVSPPVHGGSARAAGEGGGHGFTLADGRLADVVPTLLDLLGMEKPAQMTGTSLVVRTTAAAGAAE
jgi:2,3-bisphosphoglycerate-independent phosphoglycerate mutase